MRRRRLPFAVFLIADVEVRDEKATRNIAHKSQRRWRLRVEGIARGCQIEVLEGRVALAADCGREVRFR